MKKIRLFFLILITCVVILSKQSFVSAQGSGNSFPITATVSRPANLVPISPFIWGAQLYPTPGTILTANQYFTRFISEAKVKSLGIKLLRFPGGCWTDSYNWKTSRITGSNNGNIYDSDFMSVDEALSLSSRIGADIIYGVNVETKGLIDPCGDVTSYKGTLQDAVDLVQKYHDRITYYELGNEPWGYWDPTEYGQVALQFAQAMKQVDNTIKISITGFPTTGNNQNPDQPTQAPDLAWTNMIKGLVNSQCSGVPCFDFVTDHPYETSGYNPLVNNYSPINFPGVAAYFPSINYKSIFQERNTDYSPAKLDLTEWNMKCWQSTSNANPSINTVEQGMFILDSMLQMAQNAVHAGIYYSLHVTNGGCNLFFHSPTADRAINAQGQAFSISSVLANGQLLNSTVSGPVKPIPLDPSCTQASCLRGGVDAPYVSVYSGISSDNKLYLFLLNRHETQTANVTVNLSGLGNLVGAVGEVKYLTASTYTADVFTESTEAVTVGQNNTLSLNIPPIGIARISIPILAGDLTGDGYVNNDDYLKIVAEFTTHPYTIFDYNTLVGNFGQ